MEALFLKTLNMSITASYVIAAVVLIHLLLKKAPKKYSYLLWSVVGFRLCCPVSFISMFSIFSLRPFDMTAAQSSGGAMLQYVPDNISTMAQPSVTVGIPTANTVISSALSAATPAASINPLHVWIGVGTVLWCVGIAVLLIYSIATYIRLHKQMADAVLLEGNVWQSDKVRSPFVLGFFRPRIYVPFGLDENTQRYMLTHERYHIRRLDHFIKPFAFLLLSVHWFNPLCWLTFVLMGRDMEMSCDEKVLSSEDNIKRGYSTSLLSFASNRRFPSPSPLAFGETGVKSRIKNALKWKRPKLWITLVAAALCIGGVAACAANPQENEEEKGTNIFSSTYSVDAIVFEASQYSFAYTTETAPEYSLTSDCQLLTRGPGESDWRLLGELSEITLTEENFDNYIWRADGTPDCWNSEVSRSAIRKGTQKAWRLDVDDDPNHVFYLVLQQKNGDVYLAYGYYDPEGETKSDDSSIRWLFKLSPMDSQTIISFLTPQDQLSSDYSLEEAKNDGCVIYENGDITSGQSVWDSFVTTVDAGEPSTVRIGYYYTLNDPSRYAPELYEEIKDDYPVLYIKDLTFDGKGYTIEGFEDGGLISQQFQFLMKYEGKPSSTSAVFSEYVYYVLTNDDSVTWEEIEQGMYSSQAGAWIDHYRVYSNLTYK